MQNYPKSIDEKNVVQVVRKISQLREEDILDRNNFPAIFFLGRKVGKVPASSLDIAATDRVGDMNYDTNFLYLFPTVSGWRRIALATW